jgi:hypothetical protein
VLEPIGLQLRPQLLDDHTYSQVLDILATAAKDSIEDDAGSRAELTLDDLPAAEDTPGTLGGEEAADTGDPNEPDKGPTAPLRTTDSGAPPAPEAAGGPSLATRIVQESPSPVPEAADHPAGDAENQEPVEEPPASDAAHNATDVRTMPRPAPRILVLGRVIIENAAGTVEPTKRNRLTELAAFLALHPGCDHTSIDAAQWPGHRVSDNTRNTAMSKLRRWLGKTSGGEDYLPRYQAGTGYQLHDRVDSDWAQWQRLLPDASDAATTEDLEAALALVRGRPFDGVRARRYTWAETLEQHMTSAIVDASNELARRRLREGRWRAAEAAVVIGLSVEPGMERLWRARILAAHSSGNTAGVQEAVDRMLAIVDELGGDLEDETEQLLTQLHDNTKPRHDDLMAAL